MPFGGGVRRCLGAAFAEFEMRVVLTEMLRRRTLEPGSTHAEHVTRRNVTFSPVNGTRVLVDAVTSFFHSQQPDLSWINAG